MKHKVLILVMSCNLPNYQRKENYIRETYAKDVLDGKYDNLDLWFFTGGEKEYIDQENHKLYINVDDRRDRTFQKLVKTLRLINENPTIFDYDYILRVNISTYVNIKLFNRFLDCFGGDNWLFAGTIFAQKWIEHGLPFVNGEVVMFSKNKGKYLVDFWKSNQKMFDALEENKNDNIAQICDDGWMTTAFHRLYKHLYLYYLNSFGIHYEANVELKHPDELKNYIAIGLKTIQADKPLDPYFLDKNPIFDDFDEEKFRQVHEICQKSNETIDIEKWWEFYKKNIFNKRCRSYFCINRLQEKFFFPKKIVLAEFFALSKKWCEMNGINFEEKYKDYLEYRKGIEDMIKHIEENIKK